MISRIRRLQRCSENASSKRRRAISHRWARMSKAIALSMFWQLQPCATPQRPPSPFGLAVSGFCCQKKHAAAHQ